MKEKTKKIKKILLILFKCIYNILGCVLWLLLITSIIIELINGGSIFRSVLKFTLPVSSFINLNAIINECFILYLIIFFETLQLNIYEKKEEFL